MERTKICKCAHNTGKLITDISDIKEQVNSLEFGNLSDFNSSNIKRHLELLERRILSESKLCDIDLIHQVDIADNITRGTSFMMKMSYRYDFEKEKSMILHNLGIIQEQIIQKLENC